MVEDERSLREIFSTTLEFDGHTVAVAGDGREALDAARTFLPEVVLLDLRLPDVHGFDLIPPLRELDELVAVVVLTALSEVPVVVRAMQLGADDFLVKPVDIETLGAVVCRHLERRRADRRNRALRLRAGRPGGLIGESVQIQRITEQVAQVAPTDTTILVEGESGTGKGLVAAEIHRMSDRADGPFLDLNCAALSPSLLESELFGHEQGAFTDASRAKPGLLEIASGGTVFLDEIGDMPPPVQSRVLKVIEDRRFRRIGGLKDLHVNVRIVTATHRDLRAMVKAGDFREDLYYRLNVFVIRIPPLRERPADILPLAHHFLGDTGGGARTSPPGFEPGVEELLLSYSWPGNARELRNVVERAVILARGSRIATHHLPGDLLPRPGRAVSGETRSLAAVESEHIQRVLELTGGNVKRSAELLGISRTTLYAKLSTYGLELPR